ncbi:MAG TPA: hypothetical protein V6D35_18585 [Candidatus Sericytochromatia bacterium]|jgi:predicted RNase H-like nuclease (RuvC/YqgF family)
MAKKSLTDLLREEVEKSPDLELEKAGESTDDEIREQNTESVENLPMNTSDKSSARHSTPTKADLEATITELQAALKEAQHKEERFADLKADLEEAYRKEGALQQQINDLQSELQHQKKSVHKLEKELEKIEHLKADFEQAKKAAIQLADANEKLIQEVNTLKKGDLKKGDLKKVEETPKGPGHEIIYHAPDRPIQKENDKPADFAKTSWLL